ncbi:response regulator transcription factor [Evansella halocellulosilytica]|uniref:response regulator transcription factor n=1 Tax=Evansella halocellulosilytica TaxID=2011013 RepID=UPI000BB6B568|nr:response regulator transcription factor [Evansella halocellulosilytica]
MYQILLVEDDHKIASILTNYLIRYGYQVHVAENLAAVDEEFAAVKPDLVLLDVNLPYYDGFYWCRQIRMQSKVPILFISARTEEMNQVMAIEYGGDDYITKPFNLEVVLAKIKSTLRRAYGEYAISARQDEQKLEKAGLILHPNQFTVEYKGEQIVLTKNEFQLLRTLFQSYNAVVSREELLEALWDEDAFVDDNTLTVNVTRVRKKLTEIHVENAIHTVRGKGYRLFIKGDEPL